MAEAEIIESGKINYKIDLTKINFSIMTCDNSAFYQERLCVILELANLGEEDLYFTTYSILLSGFNNDRFSFEVSEKTDNFTAKYFGPIAKIRSHNELLKAGETVSSKLFLDDAYDFTNLPDKGTITIAYHCYIDFCQSDDDSNCVSSHLDGNLSLILGENIDVQQSADTNIQ